MERREKRAIIAEAFAPGASVSEVARRAEVFPGQMVAGAESFVALLLGSPAGDEPTDRACAVIKAVVAT